MTTIACDPERGEMAGDTCVSGSGIHWQTSKVRRLPDGGIFGSAGTARHCTALFNWIAGGRKGRRPKSAAVDALILDPEGLLWFVEDGHWPPILINGAAAIGTGEQAALVAMSHFGCTPLEAVEAAATVDPITKAPFEVLRLRKRRAKRKIKSP